MPSGIIEVTEEEIERERVAIQRWVDAINNPDSSTTLEDFLEETAKIYAALHADIRRLDAVIHKMTGHE